MNRCSICEVDIPGGDEASELHNAGKRHLKLLAHREKMVSLEESSVYVKWKNASIDANALQAFNQFGGINRIIFRGERAFAIIEFAERTSAQRALKAGEFLINSVAMKIEKRKMDFSALKVPDAHVNVDEVIGKLEYAASLFEEADILIETLVIPEDEAHRRLKLCESLQKHVADYVCNSNITLFGSSVTLIGFIDSDLDAHLHIQENEDLNYIEGRNKFTLMTCDPTVFKSRKITYSEMKRLHPTDQIRLICRIINDIRKTVGWVSYPNAVLDARCPVVRLQIEKQWLLDLSVNNFIGAEKTLILDHLVRCDGSGCLRRLLVTFRFWAMSNGLCRAPFNQHVGHFNAYTLNWLLIYYLMKIDILPKLEFTTDIIPNSLWKKAKSVEHYHLKDYEFILLLKKFFVYIVETKLSEIVMGPFGQNVELSKDEFRGVNLSQEQNKDFKLSTCLNIQDPIEHSHNLSQNVTEEYVNMMKTCMKLSLSILKRKEMSLKNIFSLSTRPVSPKSFYNESGEHLIKVPLPSSANDVSNVKTFVEKFLDEIMRWELLNLSEPNMKRMKLNQELSESNGILQLGQYTVPFAVWIGRRNVKREILKGATLNEWELNSKISDAIVNGNKKENEIAVVSATINVCQEEAHACFQLVKGEKVDFDNAMHFIDQMFSKWISPNFSF